MLSQLSDNDNRCNITEKTDQNWPFVLQLSIVSSFDIGWDMTKQGTILEWQLTPCVPLQSGQR